jgi:hypothetical protein
MSLNDRPAAALRASRYLLHWVHCVAVGANP